MKTILKIFAGILILIIATLIVVPIIFKDDIKATIDEELAKSVNADIIFDLDNFGVSLISNFPNLTVTVEELGVVGRDEFKGDVLFAIDKFEVEVNIFKIIFDEKLSIKGIALNGPQIFIKVLENGKANYDIAVPSEEVAEVEETTEEAGDFSLAIDHWEITEGNVVYDDATIPTKLEIKGLNHEGNGDFSLSVFDLNTKTTISSVNVNYEGESYMNNTAIGLDLILNMDLDAMKFTFKENMLKLNEFQFGFDGWVAMPTDDIEMDLTFAAKNNTFKSIISLIPMLYMEDFDALKTSGEISFDGFAKGVYNESTMPSFQLNLGINDGMFQYPDLPTAISNVNLAMLVDNKDGNIDNTLVDISKFHVDFGNNPIDAQLRVDNLVTYPVKADIQASLNLGELSTMFPTEGLEMKGVFNAHIKADGVYDSINETIPTIDAKFALADGYINSVEAPVPLEDIQLSASVQNTSGKLSETKVLVDKFSMIMEGSPIEATMKLEDLDDYKWDVFVKAKADLGKLESVINEVYPLPGVKMAGVIDAELTTSGRMSDLDAESYDRLPTSGKLNLKEFYFSDSASLPQGMTISNCIASFNPKDIKLSTFKSKVGNSDFNATGNISNYLNYVLKENELLEGNLNLNSQHIDINEWMTEEDEEEEATDEESVPYEVIQIPENIDFVMNANIATIIYDNMTLKNAEGKILIKEGKVILDGLKTEMLGGKIVFNGSYDAVDIKNPAFDMTFGVENVSISESYKTFNTVQMLAPAAKHVIGDVSTVFEMRGLLKDDMMPNMASITGGGLLEIAQATLKSSNLTSSLTNYISSKSADDNVLLKDIAMSAKIEDGRLSVDPFDVKLSNYNANVSGSTGMDGSLDYTIATAIPANELGDQLGSALGSLTGNSTSDVDIKIGIGGTYDSPKIKLLGSGVKDLIKDQAKDAAKKAVKGELSKVVGGDVLKDTELTKEGIKTEAKEKVEEQKEELKEEAKEEINKVEENLTKDLSDDQKQVIDGAKDQLNNLFKRKKKK